MVFRAEPPDTGIGFGSQCPRTKTHHDEECCPNDEAVFFHARLDVPRGAPPLVQGESVCPPFPETAPEASLDTTNRGRIENSTGRLGTRATSSVMNEQPVWTIRWLFAKHWSSLGTGTSAASRV